MIWTFLGFVVTLAVLCLMEKFGCHARTSHKEAAV